MHPVADTVQFGDFFLQRHLADDPARASIRVSSMERGTSRDGKSQDERKQLRKTEMPIHPEHLSVPAGKVNRQNII